MVVDDNSPDGTAAAARGASAGDPRVSIDVRRGPRSLAGAVRHGLERASGDAAVVMNADFQHDPALVSILLRKLESCDLVIGSRFVPGGGMADPLRYWPSRAFSGFLRRRLGVDVRDQTCGFVALRTARLSDLNMDRVFRGYGDWFFRMLHAGHFAGWRMAEVPARYAPRRSGRSKSRLARMLVDYTRAAFELTPASGRHPAIPPDIVAPMRQRSWIRSNGPGG